MDNYLAHLAHNLAKICDLGLFKIPPVDHIGIIGPGAPAAS